MNSSPSFIRTVCVPAAWAYGFGLLGFGLWAISSEWGVTVSWILLVGGLSVLHYAYTASGLLSRRPYKPTAALDEWQLLDSDEAKVRDVRLLTRITGGLSAMLCLLVFAAVLLGLFDIYPFLFAAQSLSLDFWGGLAIALLTLLLNGLTLAFVLASWKTKYLE